MAAPHVSRLTTILLTLLSLLYLEQDRASSIPSHSPKMHSPHHSRYLPVVPSSPPPHLPGPRPNRTPSHPTPSDRSPHSSPRPSHTPTSASAPPLPKPSRPRPHGSSSPSGRRCAEGPTAAQRRGVGSTCAHAAPPRSVGWRAFSMAQLDPRVGVEISHQEISPSHHEPHHQPITRMRSGSGFICKVAALSRHIWVAQRPLPSQCTAYVPCSMHCRPPTFSHTPRPHYSRLQQAAPHRSAHRRASNLSRRDRAAQVSPASRRRWAQPRPDAASLARRRRVSWRRPPPPPDRAMRLPLSHAARIHPVCDVLASLAAFRASAQLLSRLRIAAKGRVGGLFAVRA